VVAITSGDGIDTVILSGIIAQIDNLLTGVCTDTITYTASGTSTIDATFTVTVNDQSNTGDDPGTSGTTTTEEGTNSVTVNTFVDIEFGISASSTAVKAATF